MLNPNVFIRAAELMDAEVSNEEQGACFFIYEAFDELYGLGKSYLPYVKFFSSLFRKRNFVRAYYMAYDDPTSFGACSPLPEEEMKERRILALLLAAEIARDEAKLPKSSKRRQK